MAINNFTLQGINASVQFGIGFARLKATSSAQFQVRDAADSVFVNMSGADALIADDFTTLRQLQAATLGLSWKEPVRLASVADVDIATELEAGDLIDGVAVAEGDRVLLKNQTLPIENGIYIAVAAAAGAASRSTDMATGSDAVNAAMFVSEGATQADQGYVETAEPAIVDTDDLTFLQFASVVSGVTSIASVDDGGGGGTFVSMVVNGAAPIPTIRSVANGTQIAAVASGGGNELDLTVVAGSIGTTELGDNQVTEPKLAAGVAVLYRGFTFLAADFPAVPGSVTVNLGDVLPTPATVMDGGVLITAAFNNSPTLEVGVSGTPGAVLQGTEIDLGTLGTYQSSRASVQDGLQLIGTLTTNVSQPTLGTGQGWVRFMRLT